MSVDSPELLDRYSRQVRFPALGEAGQRKLLASRVTICGCGALGTVLANHLARAGVGRIRIVDRDFIETHNLQRQVLFDEADVESGLPKAEAAARKLIAQGKIDRDGSTVLCITGNGLKTQEAIEDKVARPVVIRPTMAEFEALVGAPATAELVEVPV